MTERKILPITELGLSDDGKIHICEEANAIYFIQGQTDIYVEENIQAIFMDNTNNGNIHIYVASNANVEYLILDSHHTHRYFCVDGEVKLTQISLEETEEELNISINHEAASVYVQTLSISSKNKFNFKQYISHNAKGTFSNVSNVGVAMNASKIIFDTTGKIEKGMVNSKCQQVSRGIVMDDISEVTAKPILLIDEYDCFANHGAAIGKMSDEDLFYLMSRGLNKKEAFLLILQGIVEPFISSIPIPMWQDRIKNEVLNLIEK